MKKLSVCFALVLMLVLMLCPGAYAQEINLGSFVQGQNVDVLMTVVYGPGAETTLIADPGLRIEQEYTGGGTGIYLRGIPGSTGSFSIDVYEPNGMMNTYRYTVSPSGGGQQGIVPSYPGYSGSAQTPTIAGSSNVSCQLGDYALLSAAATVYDGGYLSYQWFYSYSNVNYGGMPIAGASSPEYVADTSNAGTIYYYCTATNNLNGTQASASTNPIAVTVNAPQVQHLMVNTPPNKTSYIVGDGLDTTGLSLIVYKSNGDQEIVYNGFTCTPMNFDRDGQINVQVNWNGWTCTFPVTVAKQEAPAQSISVFSMPSKTSYKTGDGLDTSGLVLRVYKTDGSYEDINYGYTCAPMVLSSPGAQSITVSYMGKSCSFSVSVADAEKTLSVTSTPAKLKYQVGERLDTSGLVLKLSDGNGVQMVRSGFTCSPETFSTLGTQTVTVSYAGKTTSFTVTVVEAAPSPSPSAAPEKDEAEDGDEGEDKKDRVEDFKGKQNKSKKTVLVVALILCVVALMGLGAYMVYLRKVESRRGRRR